MREFEWDHEHTLLDGWNLAFNGSWPLQLSGKVFNNAGPGLEDGDLVEYTSQVEAARGCSPVRSRLQPCALGAAALCARGCNSTRLVEYTSQVPTPTTLGHHLPLHGGQIVSFKGRVAITKSGTKYYLGSPSPLFEAIRLQLCRATAAAEQGPVKAAAISDSFFPFDSEHPFSLIDLGHSGMVKAALARSSPCGHSPLQRPTRLLGAALWAREQSHRRVDA